MAQWADLRPGMAARHDLVAGMPAGVPPRLFDPFWVAAAKAYSRGRAVPAANMGEGWESLARFAAAAGLPTDSVYIARVDRTAVAALREKGAKILASGSYETATPVRATRGGKPGTRSGLLGPGARLDPAG